jgi:polyisoprenoid-binding protein YceI
MIVSLDGDCHNTEVFAEECSHQETLFRANRSLSTVVVREGHMIKMNIAAVLVLSGSLFVGKALFAQNDAPKPAQLVAASENGLSVTRSEDPQGIPVFKITPVESKIKFDVEASVAITGTFDKWDATLTFTSTDVTTGVLDIKIQADSVDTGSNMKNGKLKGKDFFDVKQNPMIAFKSTKIEQTGPDSFAVDGDFTIRGVTRHEKLLLTVSGKGTGSGTIAGTMAFDRKEYGMNSGIPFIKIANRVEVSVSLKGKRISGPPLALK